MHLFCWILSKQLGSNKISKKEGKRNVIGLGTLINMGATVAGGLIGMVIKNRFKPQFQQILMSALGLSTMFIGISGALTGLLSVGQNGKINTQGTMLMIASLVIGALVGEFFRIEDRLDAVGVKLQKAVGAKDHSTFVEGFVTASLVICIGAMGVVGSINDGLTGDISMLAAKSVLDFFVVMILAAAMGGGVVFSALPLGIYQGAVTACAAFVAPYISDTLIANLSYIGSALIFGVGVNLVFGKKFKVGNMVPALLVPIVWELVSGLIGKV